MHCSKTPAIHWVPVDSPTKRIHYSDVQWPPILIHMPLDCLYSSMNRLISKKTSTLHHWSFVKGIHRCPMDSPHKRPVTRKIHIMKSNDTCAKVVDMHPELIYAHIKCYDDFEIINTTFSSGQNKTLAASVAGSRLMFMTPNYIFPLDRFIIHLYTYIWLIYTISELLSVKKTLYSFYFQRACKFVFSYMNFWWCLYISVNQDITNSTKGLFDTKPVFERMLTCCKLDS